MSTKRGKACLISIFSMIANCQSMAYRSFKSEKCSARGVRKVTTGITYMDRPDPESNSMRMQRFASAYNPTQPTLE